MTDVFAPPKITFRVSGTGAQTLTLPPAPSEFSHALTAMTAGSPSTLSVGANLNTLYGLSTTPPNDKFIAIFTEIPGYAINTNRSITGFLSGPTSYCTISADLLALHGLKPGDTFALEFTATPGGITGLTANAKIYLGRVGAEASDGSSTFTMQVPTTGTFTSGGTIKVLYTGVQTGFPSWHPQNLHVATVTATGATSTFTIPATTAGTYVSGGAVIIRLPHHDRSRSRFILERLDVSASVGATPSTGGNQVITTVGFGGLALNINTTLAANTSNSVVYEPPTGLVVPKMFGLAPSVSAPSVTEVTWQLIATGYMD